MKMRLIFRALRARGAKNKTHLHTGLWTNFSIMPQKPLRERFRRQTPIPAPHGLKSLLRKLFKPCGAILSKIQFIFNWY